MAITNRDRVGSAMDTLKSGLAPFVSRSSSTTIKDGPTKCCSKS